MKYSLLSLLERSSAGSFSISILLHHIKEKAVWRCTLSPAQTALQHLPNHGEAGAMIEAFFGIPGRKPREFNRISVSAPNAPFILDKKKIVITNKRIFIILPFFVKILC